MPRLRYLRLVVVALTRAVLASKRGRWALVGFGAAVAAGLFASGEQATTRKGAWKGLDNMIAPRSGTLTIDGAPGKGMRCTVRGRAGLLTGNGWIFRGDADADETSCTGEIGRDGRVAAVLKLQLTWRGKEKGIGGDWDEVSGEAVCEGDLRGTLATGGDWTARCKSKGKEWGTSITWKLDGE